MAHYPLSNDDFSALVSRASRRIAHREVRDALYGDTLAGASSAESIDHFNEGLGTSGIGDDGDLSTPYNFQEYLSGLLSSVGAENEANRTYNATQAAINRTYQERMSNTAYQRAVADLKAAGLNPVLAYSNLNSATVPSTQAASYNVGGGDTLSDIWTLIGEVGKLLSGIGSIIPG